jgi:hypothetical protein
MTKPRPAKNFLDLLLRSEDVLAAFTLFFQSFFHDDLNEVAARI